MTSPFPPGAAVLAYLRDSGGDNQELSTAQQLDAIQTYCTQHHLILLHTYTDQSTPGSSIVGRLAFQTLLHHLRTHRYPVAGLLLWSYSRFARDLDDAQFIRADLRRLGYTLHSLTDPIPQGTLGRLFEAIVDWKNDQFLHDLSTDVKRGLRNLVLTHRAVPGTPPTGFRRIPITIGARRNGIPRLAHRWEPDPDYIPIIRLAFQLRASGASYQTIRQQTGLTLAKASYPTFFRNKIYAGILEYADLTISDYCTPIVDAATFAAVQARQGTRTPGRLGARHPRQTGVPYALSGLLRCARCGSPLIGHRVRSWRYYVCTKRRQSLCDLPKIPQIPLETAIHSELVDHLLQPQILLDLQTELKNRQAAQIADTHLAVKQRRLATLRRKIANLTAAIADAGHSPALLATLKTHEDEAHNLTTQLEQHRLAALPDPYTALNLDDLNALSNRLIERLNRPTADRHALYRQHIHHIDLDRTANRIHGQIHLYRPDVDPPKANPPPKGGGHTQVYGLCPQPASSHNPVIPLALSLTLPELPRTHAARPSPDNTSSD